LSPRNKIQFLALLQTQNRIQIPVEIRQHFKLEPKQFLRVEIKSIESWYLGEEFFARLSSDGRITVPWETRWKLKLESGKMLRVLLHLEDQQ